MGPKVSRPDRQSIGRTLRTSELLELSRQLSSSDVTEVLHRLSPTIHQARIEATRGNPDEVLKLFLEWHKSCGAPTEARAELSMALSLARRQDLADELEANDILHVSLCRQQLRQRYERLLGEEGWKENSYIKPKLKQTDCARASESSTFRPLEFLKMPRKSILIEGGVGMGKTMLMRGLVAEWIKGYKKGASLPLLFLLASDRITQDDSLPSAIHREYFSTCGDITENELDDYIEKVPEGCLVAIDAVPDTRAFLRTKIGMSLCEKEEASNKISLIITSRPGNASYFHPDMAFKIDPFSAEEVETLVRNAFSSSQTNEEAGRNLLDFLQQSVGIRDELCSIPLLCGVMCRLWSICQRQEEGHLLDRITHCSGIAQFAHLVAEALVRENITDIEPDITPTPMFNFLALFQDSGDCGVRPDVEVLQTMENLGQVAFRKLKKDSISFREGAFASCPRSYKIACYARVLVRRGHCTEFFHPIIQAYCVAAYLVKLHNSSTIAFHKALSELDDSGSSYRKWVYRFVSGNTDMDTVRDVINHLAQESKIHNLLCESLGESLGEVPDDEQDTRHYFHVITWPSHIVLKDPTAVTLSGFYSTLRYATNLSEVTINQMSSGDAEKIRNPFALLQLQELHLNLSSLFMTECNLPHDSILFRALTPRSLRVLDLTNSTATADLTDAPDVFLSRLSRLTTLRLPDIDRYPCLLLASLPECCPGLGELSLSFQRPCCHSGKCKVCCCHFHKLESLLIKSGSSVKSQQSQHLANVISCAITLKNISLKCIDEGFIEFLATLQHVQEAQLEFTNIDAGTLDHLLHKLPHLKHVNLEFGGRQESEILSVFAVLASIKNLNELNVKYNALGVSDADRPALSPATLRDVHELLRKLSHLQTLTMTDVPLDDMAALDILQDVKSGKITVTILRLTRCKTNPSGPYDSICKDIRGCDVSIVHGMSGCMESDLEQSASPRTTGDQLCLPGTPHFQATQLQPLVSKPTRLKKPKPWVSWYGPIRPRRPSFEKPDDEKIMDKSSQSPPTKRSSRTSRKIPVKWKRSTSDDGSSKSKSPHRPVDHPKAGSKPAGPSDPPDKQPKLVSLPVLLPHILKTKLCLLLRPGRYSGNDWRALAERFKLDKFASDLSGQSNPVEKLFEVAEEKRCFTSLQELMAVFASIDREDCAYEVRRYLEHVNDE